MSDHIEHACGLCGSLLHHADECRRVPMNSATPIIRGYAGSFHRFDEVVSAIDYERLQLENNQLREGLRVCKEKLLIIEHATNNMFGSGQGAYHENALQAAQDALSHHVVKGLKPS